MLMLKSRFDGKVGFLAARVGLRSPSFRNLLQPEQLESFK